jgi:hypothetical protein
VDYHPKQGLGGRGFKSPELLALPPVMATARISAKFENFFLFQGEGGGDGSGRATRREAKRATK